MRLERAGRVEMPAWITAAGVGACSIPRGDGFEEYTPAGRAPGSAAIPGLPRKRRHPRPRSIRLCLPLFFHPGDMKSVIPTDLSETSVRPLAREACA